MTLVAMLVDNLLLTSQVFVGNEEYFLSFLVVKEPISLFNTVAIELLGGNRIRRTNIKAQHSAFSFKSTMLGFDICSANSISLYIVLGPHYKPIHLTTYHQFVIEIALERPQT